MEPACSILMVLSRSDASAVLSFWRSCSISRLCSSMILSKSARFNFLSSLSVMVIILFALTKHHSYFFDTEKNTQFPSPYPWSILSLCEGKINIKT